MANRIKIGISSCLIGENVRWNGGHSRDRYLTDILGQYVEYVPVCPEVECGMGVPRETLRLVGDPDNPNLVTSKTNVHTHRMNEWARKRVVELEKENLCGFVFKKNSPSSGLFRVPVTNFKGMPQKKGQGIFARVFTDYFPYIMGYFKKLLSPYEKQELLEIIEQYRQEYVPLIVPVTLLNHYVRKYKQPYLAQQVYLNPHPVALKLRNHV